MSLLYLRSFAILILLFALLSCGFTEKEKPDVTPWGEEIVTDGEVGEGDTVSVGDAGNGITLGDIVDNGELIMLTVYGPSTYYDYHGHGMGINYLLCEKFAQQIGVSLRVEVCKDSAEVVKRLADGEGDIAVLGDFKSWKVNDSKGDLAAELKKWYSPELSAQVKKDMDNILSFGFVKRRVYPFMLSRKDAVISKYDELFRKYASIAKLDWTLMAAQCYQESCFDPDAHSWAGACGLMQILPTTADHLGLPRSQIYSPEQNIYAAARYMAELQQMFSDVGNRQERINFALASYNGGYYHVKDAMALARKYGRNPQRWSDVREFILGLSSPKYYNDPVVRNGYMRGSETANYVDKIIDRWRQYRSATRGKYSSSVNAVPQPSKRENKWTKRKGE